MNHLHGANCGCSHEVKTEDLTNLYSLYSRIDKENLECLNESHDGAGKTVFRAWDLRLDRSQVCVTLDLTRQTCLNYVLTFSLLKVMPMKSCSLIFRELSYSSISARSKVYCAADSQEM